METRAGYLAVGSAVLILLAAAIGFVLWMAKYDGNVQYDRYWLFFTDSVVGLKTGSTVSYRGIAVGQVIDLRIDPRNAEQVRATIEVLNSTPVKSSTVASLELQGLTGGSMILLSGGSKSDPPLKTAPDDDYPVIGTKPSQLERLFEGAPALVERVDTLVSRAALLLSDDNRRAVSTILANMAALSDDLKAAGPGVRELIARTTTTVADVDRIVTESEDDIKTALAATAKTMQAAEPVLAEAEKTFAAFKDAGTSVSTTTNTLNAMLQENRRPIRDFTHVTLYDMNAFIADLRELVGSLRRVANELGRDPAGFLFGNQQKGYEAR